MADTPPEASKASTSPKVVKMARAVHELQTGKTAEEVIAPGEFITDAVAKKHSLDTKAIDALVNRGAVELVDVHRD